MKLKISSTLREFIQSQKFSGVLLIFCTLTSLIIANSFFSENYLSLLHLKIGLPGQNFPGMSVEHFVNDGLMAVFFLLVGLEIKRELIDGELSSFEKASIPVSAAIGGMILPALLYALFNHGTDTASGWGIPMATDIAFAIGVLSLLGNRVPDSLKILLTALAVVDDLGAVLVIALFYSSGISFFYLMLSGLLLLLLFIMNRSKVKSLVFYLIPGILLWYFMYCSGVHSTISGVLLAMVIPFRKNDEHTPLLRLEHWLHRPVNFIIMPLFALVNTAIVFDTSILHQVISPESFGIATGLILGKPIGILLFIGLALTLKIGKLPEGISMKHIAGIGILGGIGFTMSIFISLLAFKEPTYILNAKLVILLSSFIAGTIGYFVLLKINDTKTGE